MPLASCRRSSWASAPTSREQVRLEMFLTLSVTPTAVLIADYKSDRNPPTRLDAVDRGYIRQLAAYRAALRQIYPDRPLRAALVWTEGPTIMEIPEALLDEALV